MGKQSLNKLSTLIAASRQLLPVTACSWIVSMCLVPAVASSHEDPPPIDLPPAPCLDESFTNIFLSEVVICDGWLEFGVMVAGEDAEAIFRDWEAALEASSKSIRHLRIALEDLGVEHSKDLRLILRARETTPPNQPSDPATSDSDVDSVSVPPFHNRLGPMTYAGLTQDERLVFCTRAEIHVYVTRDKGGRRQLSQDELIRLVDVGPRCWNLRWMQSALKMKQDQGWPQYRNANICVLNDHCQLSVAVAETPAQESGSASERGEEPKQKNQPD